MSRIPGLYTHRSKALPRGPSIRRAAWLNLNFQEVCRPVDQLAVHGRVDRPGNRIHLYRKLRRHQLNQLVLVDVSRPVRGFPLYCPAASPAEHFPGLFTLFISTNPKIGRTINGPDWPMVLPYRYFPVILLP